MSMSTINRNTPNLYLLKLCYRPEYKKTYWWVKYGEQPGIICMFYSVCEKWAEISKGNCVHKMWMKIFFKTWKKSFEKICFRFTIIHFILSLTLSKWSTEILQQIFTHPVKSSCNATVFALIRFLLQISCQL